MQAEAEFSEIRSDALEVYLAFAASDVFFTRRGRWPGTAPSDDEDASLDAEELKGCAIELVKRLGGSEVWERLEMVLGEVFALSSPSKLMRNRANEKFSPRVVGAERGHPTCRRWPRYSVASWRRRRSSS